MIASLLGLDSATWTALGTIALVGVTIVYVVVTRRIASHSKDAAEAAKRSAEATERSVTAAEAAAAHERERLEREVEAVRVRLMRGLLAEVRENTDLTDRSEAPFPVPFVRDIWQLRRNARATCPTRSSIRFAALTRSRRSATVSCSGGSS